MVDDVDVARALLDAVAQFGRERGMTEVVGPLGFTDFDPEGMLTDGFDQLGTMATIYNYPYYPKLMEQLGGWEKDNDYVEFKLIVPDTVPEKYTKVARLVEKRFNLHVRILTRHEILKEGYGRKIFHLINETFKDIYGFSELSDKQVDMYVNDNQRGELHHGRTESSAAGPAGNPSDSPGQAQGIAGRRNEPL